MQPENLAYALIQVAHNFGAVAVLGGALFALWPLPRLEQASRFAWLILAGWGAQILSGGLFGLTSLHYYGALPDLSPVAMSALIIKVGAAIGGVWLAATCLVRGRSWDAVCMRRALRALTVLAAVALTAAAFLRWFA